MDLISGLREIGLTLYEAKVYLELLHANPATGYQLSRKAGIPRSMVSCKEIAYWVSPTQIAR